MDRMSELKASVDRLSSEARDIRREMKRKTNTIWVAMLAGGIALLTTMAAAYTVTINNAEAIDTNNRKFCPVIEILLPLKGDDAPTTERGRDIVARAEKVARELHC